MAVLMNKTEIFKPIKIVYSIDYSVLSLSHNEHRNKVKVRCQKKREIHQEFWYLN